MSPPVSMAATIGTADLFGAPAVPDGFKYQPEVLSEDEEQELVRRFEKLPFKPFEFKGYLGNRRIYTFGRGYIFAGQEPRADARIPSYLLPLQQIAGRISGKQADAFEQIMITEYAPGAGIGWHRDRPSYEDIAAISFVSPCRLRLKRKLGTWQRQSVLIEPRSAYLLHGPVRNSRQHSIAPQGELRYSVTLRTFKAAEPVSKRDR